MSTGSILSILAYPQYDYHLVYHTGLSLVHCSYLSVGSLHSDRDVRLWWSTHALNKPMDLLFYDHRQTAGEDESPSHASLSFSRRNNRGPSPDKSPSSDDDSSEEDMNLESSMAATKRGTRWTRTNSMKKTGMVWRSGQADVNQVVSDNDCFSFVSADPGTAAIRASPPCSMLSPGRQYSYPRAHLNDRALRPSQQT